MWKKKSYYYIKYKIETATTECDNSDNIKVKTLKK
jgi:hypothetical protein